MRVTASSENRIVGHVAVKIASQVVPVPIRAVALTEAGLPEGFFDDGPNGFGIRIDSRATEAQQRAAVERATVAAAQFLSRKFLN